MGTLFSLGAGLVGGVLRTCPLTLSASSQSKGGFLSMSKGLGSDMKIYQMVAKH